MGRDILYCRPDRGGDGGPHDLVKLVTHDVAECRVCGQWFEGEWYVREVGYGRIASTPRRGADE